MGHVYRPAADGSDTFLPTDIWHLDDPARYESFRATTMRTTLASGVGLTGRVARTGHPAWLPDVTIDSGCPRARAAAAVDIHAGVAFPVIVDAEVAAVVELFTPHVIAPNPGLLEAMVQIGS